MNKVKTHGFQIINRQFKKSIPMYMGDIQENIKRAMQEHYNELSETFTGNISNYRYELSLGINGITFMNYEHFWNDYIDRKFKIPGDCEILYITFYGDKNNITIPTLEVGSHYCTLFNNGIVTIIEVLNG